MALSRLHRETYSAPHLVKRKIENALKPYFIPPNIQISISEEHEGGVGDSDRSFSSIENPKTTAVLSYAGNTSIEDLEEIETIFFRQGLTKIL